MSQLRDSLQLLVESAQLGMLSTEERDVSIAELVSRHSVTLRTIALVDPFGANCLAHALGLAVHRDYAEIADRHRTVFAGRDYLSWLLENERLERDSTAPIVLYYCEGTWKHAGVIREDGVVHSKWNCFGAFEHDIWAVPTSYGDDLVRVRGPDSDRALQDFFEFAEGRGVPFE